MKLKRKGIQRTRRILSGVMVAAMLSLSGCQNAEQTAVTEQPEVQKEAGQVAENSSVQSEEEALETVDEAEKEDVPEEEDNTENMDNTENIETEPETVEEMEQKEENIPIQGRYPAQISVVDEYETEINYFFDTDGDIIKKEEKAKDGSIKTEETEYVLDEQGNKIYGLTEDSLNDTVSPIEYDACKHKIVDRPLINTIKSTNSASDSRSEYTLSYDADHRVIKTTESSGVTNYTYEEQDGNLIVTITDENNNKWALQYDKDQYLILNISQDSDSEFFSKINYEYDDKKQLIAILEESLQEDNTDITKITYDAAGNIQRTENGSYCTEYEGYDEDGNWMTRTDYKDDEISCFVVCEYDDHGNRLSRSFGIGDEMRSAIYHYDEEGRLLDISVDDSVLYQITYNGGGLLERVEKVNEYEYSETEEESTYGYVLDQDIWQEVERYIGKYTGIASSIDSVSSSIYYHNGATFSY